MKATPDGVLVFDRAGVAFSGRAILHDLTFSVNSGEIVGLVGPNGAGKTTLLRAALGLITLTHGSITLRGDLVSALAPGERARRAAYVPQRETVAGGFTARNVVGMSLYAHGSRWGLSPSDHARINMALASVSATDLGDRKCDTLSGGEAQKIWLAAALVQGAPLLLLDEPTAFLDPQYQCLTADTLRRARERDGVATLFVTHDLNLALTLADRVIALDKGRIVFNGAPQDLATGDTLKKIYGVDFHTSRLPDGKYVLTPFRNRLNKCAEAP